MHNFSLLFVESITNVAPVVISGLVTNYSRCVEVTNFLLFLLLFLVLRVSARLGSGGFPVRQERVQRCGNLSASSPFSPQDL
ncbi:hypothetical protein E2C01_090745 [Portunus trituberculatus]|uniref:Uncharacterized protein n=1 Tax=Portunus trituberculatus TaxID=210409 RepID=A0A5B7JL53_PORTR|nr:hypothetical protein [Portunus trituberculatus]